MVIEGNPMLLLGNDFLATHAASIQLASDSADGSITLGAPSTVAPLEVNGSPSPDAPPIFRVSTSPIAMVPVSLTCAQVCPTSANPITTDFFRGPQAAENDNQLVSEPLFNTADEFAAKAPASCGSEYGFLRRLFFIDHIPRNSQANVIPSKACSIDEMTIGFQAGKHGVLKQRCHRYKRAGDGFQADALCLDGGYLLAFAFRGDKTVPVYNANFSTPLDVWTEAAGDPRAPCAWVQLPPRRKR